MMRFITTWFYIGLLKPAPGTWGSLGALPFVYIFLINNFNIWHFLLISLVVFVIGYGATYVETKGKTEHDPSEIVIDEIVGQWITFAPLFVITSNTSFHISISESVININTSNSTYSMSLAYIFLSAFALFRFFDIIKPWPISWADKISTPFGVMLDDVLAGILSAICFSIILFFGLTL